MKIKNNNFKMKKYQEKKRLNQRKFNYLNYEKLENLKFEKISNRYENYDKILEKSELFENKENSIFYLKLKNYDKKILLRDKIEKSFFFNKFIMIEFQENEEKDFIKFLENSNFIIIEEKDFIILDIEKDFIK